MAVTWEELLSAPHWGAGVATGRVALTEGEPTRSPLTVTLSTEGWPADFPHHGSVWEFLDIPYCFYLGRESQVQLNVGLSGDFQTFLTVDLTKYPRWWLCLVGEASVTFSGPLFHSLWVMSSSHAALVLPSPPLLAFPLIFPHNLLTHMF